jgi:hypothetical protein
MKIFGLAFADKPTPASISRSICGAPVHPAAAGASRVYDREPIVARS